ncbi:phospholipid transporting ATPase, partial [Dimargaris xerosporica]
MSTPAWQRWLPWGRSAWSQGNITQTNDPAATAGGPERRIYLNTELPAAQLDPHGHPIRTYPPNRINTSKYSLITFVPKNLFEQFRRVANQYFLFLIILQLIPAVSEGSAALSALALGFILFVTALKDGYEDFKRHQSDDELNHERTYVLKDWTNPNASVRAATSSLPVWLQRLVSFWQPSTLGARGSRRHQMSLDHHAEKPFTQSAHGLDDPAQWSKTYWQQVQVGDIVRLRDDDPVPADLLILATSDPDGLCYVETKNLDGETNLKLRKALPATYAWASLEELRTSPLYVDCEAPNTNLYSFKGTMTHTRAGTARTAAEVEQIGQTEPVSIDNVLLRGCVLRNTQYIVGLVLYTGAESKIILNSGETPSKRSNIERLMNTQVSLNFIMLFILCLLSAICGAFIYNQSDTSQAVFATVFDPDPDSAPFLGFLTFWMGLILFQNI